MTRRGVERFESPVVEDEQIDTTERAQQTRVAAVAARQGEIGEQPRYALRDKAKVEQAAVADRVGQAAAGRDLTELLLEPGLHRRDQLP
jgi:hypothetical protein